jgi:predicted RecA/RadA family phage recombinase
MAETLLNMRSDRFKSLQVTTASPGITAGKLTALAGGLVGVAAETEDTGDVGVIIYKCDKIVVEKGAGTGKTITQGAYVYYNPTDGKVYKDSATSRRKCGVALEAAAAEDTEVLIELDGTMGITAQTA